jgi:hypothetical protein
MKKVDVMSAVVCGWAHLNTLKVDGLSPKALVHVAALPNLHKFTFCDTYSHPFIDTFPTVPLPGFPALRELTLKVQSLSF